MLSEDRMLDARASVTTPSAAGEWPLNALRWSMLRAMLVADGGTSRLGAHLERGGKALADAGLRGPVPLAPHHHADDFDCGVDKLNQLLRDSVATLAAQRSEQLRTRVMLHGKTIAGYYSTRVIHAYCDGNPAERIPLLFVARCGMDRRWRQPGVAADMFMALLRESWGEASPENPRAIMGLTIAPSAKRFFRSIGARPAGDVIDARAIVVTARDMESALRSASIGGCLSQEISGGHGA